MLRDLSDGQPTDMAEKWRARLAELKDSGFRERPNLMAFGVGDADSAVIRELRGLGVRLDTARRAEVAERVSVAPPAVSRAAGVWLRRGVFALWIVAGTVVLLLVLSRLFAAAMPVPDAGGGAPAGSGGSPYDYYNPGYYPGGARRAGRSKRDRAASLRKVCVLAGTRFTTN